MFDIIAYIGLGLLALGALLFIAGFFSDLDEILWTAGAIVMGIGLVLFLIGAIVSDAQNKNRLRAQCLADGKKEYECYNMLKQDTVPVFIPIPMGR